VYLVDPLSGLLITGSTTLVQILTGPHGCCYCIAN